MKKTFLSLLAAGIVSASAISPAAAQTVAALVKVPFRFIVGDTVMPAGSYRITPQTDDWSVLMISAVDGQAIAAFASTEATPNPAPRSEDVRVRFDNYYGQYFLRQVAVPGRDARLVVVTKAQAERTLSRLNLMPNQHGDPAR